MKNMLRMYAEQDGFGMVEDSAESHVDGLSHGQKP
ncbi:MAG: hypothetical protein QOE54_2082 [Streptosporangiaceae bacterium]|nr:hypothetical protein [Streptosporangiaceae bacterium]